MKKFLLKLLLFAVLFVTVDKTAGLVATYLFDHAKSGATEKNKYIASRTNEDLLIFGSSRGVHHYDPRILEDSLGISCYNCAYDGCGIITAYGLLVTLTEHYTPQAIIYDVMPNFDYLVDGEPNAKYLGPLKLLKLGGVKPEVDSIFINISPSEQWKMMSNMYKINSKLIQLITENLTERNATISGYLPMNKKMLQEPEVKEKGLPTAIDEMKRYYLIRFVQLCKQKNIQLVFYASPSFRKTLDYQFDYIKELSHKEGIPFINYYCDTLFVWNRDYFYDSVHMNQIGATAYSRIVASEMGLLLRNSRN